MCFDDFPAAKYYDLECCAGQDHGYCGGCLQSMLQFSLSSSEMPTCKSCTPFTQLTPGDVDTSLMVAASLGDDVEQLRGKYETVCTLVALAKAGAQKVECLSCGEVVTLDPGDDLPEEYMCRACGNKPQLSMEASHPADRQYLESQTVSCSGCKAPMQKAGGCDHIHCTRCDGHTCWGCGQRLNPDAIYDHFVLRDGTYRCP